MLEDSINLPATDQCLCDSGIISRIRERFLTSLLKISPFNAFTSQSPMTFSVVVGGETVGLVLLVFYLPPFKQAPSLSLLW